MTKKRPRLRLRKQIIISLPIALFVILISTFLVINQKRTFANEVSPYEVAATPSNDIEGIKLSELKTIANLNNMIETRQKDNTVIYYANAYHVNVDVALEVVHQYTDNYTNPTFLTTNVIGNDNIVAKCGSFTSFEAGIVYFIRDFYVYPDKYGRTIEEVRLEPDPVATPKQVSSDGKIYMDNGLTFEQYVGKISRLFGLDPSLVLAVTYQETGIMTSGLFTISNNIGGHRGYAGWMNFPTLEAGVIYHVLTIRNLYTKFSIDVNDPNQAALLSGIYVNGVYGQVADHWLGKVLYFQEKINEQDLFTINR